MQDNGIHTSPLGHFGYTGGTIACDGVAVRDLAERFGSPLYIYSASAIRERYRAFADAFARFHPEIHFASKACGNVRILRLLVEMGAGIDAVSGGEVERAWLAGCPMERVAFAGVGKSEHEIRAALDGSYSPLRGTDVVDRFHRSDPAGRGPVGLLNVESVEEFARVDGLARELGVHARVAMRVNPDVDAKTHPYTTTGRKHNKFGIELSRAESFYAEWSALYRSRASRSSGAQPAGAEPVGLHIHIGSPVYETEPFEAATAAIVAASSRLRNAGARVDLLDIGGGWPSAYSPEQQRSFEPFVEAIARPLEPEIARGTAIHFEPGRSIVANAGLLLTRVEYVKPTPERRFIICDAGMHTLLRPSLYGAQHAIWPVDAPSGPFAPEAPAACTTPDADIVGPICETGDFIARGRPFPAVSSGDLLAIFSAGAYGMSMSSTYNQHTRPPEVLIDSGKPELIRRRETPEDLLRHEIA